MFLFLVNIYEIVVLFSFFWPLDDDYHGLVLRGLFVFGLFLFLFLFLFFVIILILKESEKCLA